MSSGASLLPQREKLQRIRFARFAKRHDVPVTGRSNNGDAPGERASLVLSELMAVSQYYNSLDFELGAQD